LVSHASRLNPTIPSFSDIMNAAYQRGGRESSEVPNRVRLGGLGFWGPDGPSLQGTPHPACPELVEGLSCDVSRRSRKAKPDGLVEVLAIIEDSLDNVRERVSPSILKSCIIESFFEARQALGVSLSYAPDISAERRRTTHVQTVTQPCMTYRCLAVRQPCQQAFQFMSLRKTRQIMF
jgi:hypothetical protein